MGDLADKIAAEFRSFRRFIAEDGLPSIRMGSDAELADLAERVAHDWYAEQIAKVRGRDELEALLAVLPVQENNQERGEE